MTITCGFTVHLPNAELHGDGWGIHPTAVFLHGFGGSRSTWDRVWAALPDHFARLRYDQRGFGESGAEESSVFSHSDDLLALLDAQGIERADLIGVSQGGAIAVNFAIDHPNRVRKLVLISPGLVAWEWSGEWRNLWREIVDAARDDRMDDARQLWLDHPLFMTTRTSIAADELRLSIEAFSGSQWIKDYQRPTMPDVDRLSLLRASVLLLTGEADLPDFSLIGDLLEATVPNIRRIEMPDAGHLLQLERPAAVARAITDFLVSG